MQQQTVPTGFGASVITHEQLYQRFLEDRHFDDNDVRILGLELLNKEQTKDLIGHTPEWSIRIPYKDLDGAETGFDRVRLLQPKSKMKYSQARASGSHVYFSPLTNWRKVAVDVDIPIIITEGEFKAYAITKHIVKDDLLYACLGLAGVTSWTDKSGLHLHKDLMQIMWRKKTSLESRSRKVYIIFDYDGAKEDGELNDQVALAETKLAIILRGLGAEVHLCRVGKFAPNSGSKYAIDDHFLQGGTLGGVLTSTSIVMNGVDTLDVKLHEFSTKYALLNGDVIRLRDGLVLNYQKAKIDSAQHIYMQTNTVPGRNGAAPKVVVKEILMLDEYKKWPKRCNIQEIGTYPQYQGLSITPDGCYNYLKAWAYEPIKGDVSLYLEFCDYFFKDDPTFAEYWHNWVASIIQKPWIRNYTTPQFASRIEGVGKSALPELIAEMMGTGTGAPAIVMGPDEIFGPYNGSLQGKIFVVVNEPSSDREDHSAKLKNLITSDSISINNKYGSKYDTVNYVNIVFTSNKSYITKMGETARREAMYHPKTLDPKESFAKVSKLMKWARTEGGFGKILNWYYERDVSQFDPRMPAPKTASREKAIELSRSPLEDFASVIRDFVAEHCDNIGAFTNAQFIALAQAWGYDDRISTQYLRRALQSLGEVTANKVIKIAGKTVRYTVFCVAGHERDDANFAEISRKTAEAVSEAALQTTKF